MIYLPFHLAYIVLYIIAFIPRVGAFCTDEKIVPYVFLMANCLFFVGYFFTVFMRSCAKGKQGFYLNYETENFFEDKQD
jgi:hypothetical protein